MCHAGGAYAIGSCHNMWHTIALIAHTTGIKVLCIEYRLAPEHPFPAALEDALAVYKELLHTYDPSNLAILGYSAGGGLALSLTLQLQELGLGLPGVLVLFSPWIELAEKGDTETTLIGVDPILCDECNLGPMALKYVAGDEALLADPRVSPLRADFASLFKGDEFPATLLQLGLRDVSLSNAARLYRKLAAAGQSRVVFSPWEGMWHIFNGHLHVPEARQGNQEAAEFVLKHIGGSAVDSSQGQCSMEAVNAAAIHSDGPAAA